MMRLPVVTKETGFAVCRELDREEDNDFIIRLLQRLEHENPCVAAFVSRLAVQHEDPVAISFSGKAQVALPEVKVPGTDTADEDATVGDAGTPATDKQGEPGKDDFGGMTMQMDQRALAQLQREKSSRVRGYLVVEEGGGK